LNNRSKSDVESAVDNLEQEIDMSFVTNVQTSALKGARSVRRVFFPRFDPMGEALIQTNSGTVHFEHHMVRVRVASRPVVVVATPSALATSPQELELIPIEPVVAAQGV
jgi:hypothetical protein